MVTGRGEEGLGFLGGVEERLAGDHRHALIVFRGDDEDFELASGRESAEPGEDLLCGAFKPGVDLLEVRDGDGLILQIFCRPTNRSIILMPLTETGYSLKVRAMKYEKAWLGCGK